MVLKLFSQKEKPTTVDILSLIPDAIMQVDSVGKILWLNDCAAKIFRIEKNELSKMNINESIESGLGLIQQASQGERSVVGRVKSSAVKDLYVEITAQRQENFFVASFRDVTQNYKTVTNILVEHECSKKTNKDKNNFLVKLSNELRSPIQSVIGFSQAMIDGLGGSMSAKQEKYVKIINKNSVDVLYLLDKIIELAKTESNLLDYDYQIFDAVNTVQSMAREFEPIAKAKNLAVSFDSSEIIKKTIFSDENAIKFVLQNILETSVATTDIGSINIAVHHPTQELLESRCFDIGSEEFNEKNYIMVSVSDTGSGFLENDVETLFDPYTQLSKTNKKNIVRSIALASSKNIIKHLNGDIWVESEPMQGATYNFIVPVGKFM